MIEIHISIVHKASLTVGQSVAMHCENISVIFSLENICISQISFLTLRLIQLVRKDLMADSYYERK